MFPGDLPRQDHPLPKALDDDAAAKLLRSAQADCAMTATSRCTHTSSRSSTTTAQHISHPSIQCCCSGRTAARWTGTPSTRFINKAGAAAGLPHIHPHQLRHTLATQAINRGMSLEAIAAEVSRRKSRRHSETSDI